MTYPLFWNFIYFSEDVPLSRLTLTNPVPD